jgi:hypothetical protein
MKQGGSKMELTFTKVLQEFARFGFTECPLSSAEIDQCLAWGLSLDDIYAIGCDVANGYTFRDTLEYFPEVFAK